MEKMLTVICDAKAWIQYYYDLFPLAPTASNSSVGGPTSREQFDDLMSRLQIRLVPILLIFVNFFQSSGGGSAEKAVKSALESCIRNPGDTKVKLEMIGTLMGLFQGKRKKPKA
jgi:hypothetical protein